jgi:aminoglycoside phosphotransferase family enzyme/predicted kinase
MTIPPEQEATAALLARLAGRGPVETHIFAVFVGADTVWKLRKAVRLNFLDFTTLAERERTARRELELNAPHAPGLYRDVVPVTRAADGGLALGGDGAVVDWVVRMARVAPGDFLDQAMARLDGEVLDALGDAVAAMHGTLRPVARDQASALRAVAQGNHDSALAAGLPPGRCSAWLAGVMAAIAAREAWLRARGAAGFVRRAHGDLHLGNLCFWRGRPVPFDALEFDEDLATIDLGYDLAFLLMDLDVRVGRAAANRVMNRYLARMADWEMVRGLPVFLSLRAMVRAHVEARSGRRDAGLEYLARALAYLAPVPAVVVAIGGLPGTGKTTVARALAPALGPAPGAVVVRSDEVRKRLHGVAPETRLPEAAYGAEASRVVFAAVAAAVGTVAGSGHAAIADAVYLKPEQRMAVERQAAAGFPGVRFLGVWLTAPMEELEARVAGRQGDASDADIAVLRRAAAADPGPNGWLAIEAGAGAQPAARIRDALDGSS